MNKTAIKNYAVWARNKLIADIEYKAGLMGITEKGIASALPQSTSEVQFFDIGTKDYASVRGDEIRQRNSFVSAIKEKERDVGYAAAFHFIVEKVAYTWFNRLIAIRFMEVNDYLPSRVRVLSSENENKAEPDMVTKPFDTDMDFSQEEQDFIMRLKDENRLDELFRWLFIKQCFKLHEVLPLLFDSNKASGGRKNEYMELLLTISFTDKDGVLWHLVHDIKERDFRILTDEDLERQKIENITDDEMPAGQVEIIGWMYQYYNTEPKDQVFADLKKNIKISKDKIPAATQLFTPDWIVRYMVENSLGRLWVEGHPNDELKKGWQYYLEEAEQEPEVQAQLAEIRKGYSALRPEDIKAVDPCMGSGHILVYLFDVLMQIYESQGWTRREAAQSIVQNNLYGLDIDERAAQLAYFAVMMKARQYDRRFLERGIEPHVYEIRESNGMTADVLEYFANGDRKLKKDIETLMSDLRNAREYGSILNVTLADFSALYARFDEIRDDISIYAMPALNDLLPLVKRAEAMAQKYDVVVTNPPYMGNKSMGQEMLKYVQDYYPDSKADLFATFIERCNSMVGNAGFQAMITQHSWMFLSSFEKLRQKMNLYNVVNMAHLGPRAFEEIGGEVVQTTSFVFQKEHIPGYKGTYCRLVEPTSQKGKELLFLEGNSRYYVAQRDFELIGGAPFAYWASQNAIKNFRSARPLIEYSRPRVGQNTGDNERFLRLWFEVDYDRIAFGIPHEALEECPKKWIPYNKGGSFRRWYGNFDRVVNWENNGKEIKDYAVIRNKGKHWSRYIQNIENMCKEGISWSDIASTRFACRYLPQGFICDVKGSSTYPNSEYRKYILAFLN
ncbi:MAG: BREX-1 system adenine-specific DNA-methyltransferase PglX, partial [Lachnospiraceae bacterium]|nr:BREX-1 system adenine-specific DNA-methyltransferase PglX [Lachnospiraceae bacterium]